MLELHDATDVVYATRSGDAYAYWAPGDATVYRVGLCFWHRYGLDALSGEDDLVALVVMVGSYGVDKHLVLPQPRADHDAWTPSAFARAFGDEYLGWWAGVRPLLAAFGWTDDEHADVAYRPQDAVEIASLTTRERSTT